MAAHPDSKPTKVTLGLVLSWVFGVIFGLAGLTATFQGSFGFGVPLVLAAVVLLPPIRKFIQDKLSIELSTGLLTVIVVVLLVISVVNTPTDDLAPRSAGDGDSLAAKSPTTTSGSVQCETGETVRSASECPAVPQLGDRVSSGDFTWTFTKARWGYSVGSDFMRQEPDGVFLVVDVTVENTGTQAAYLSADMVKLVDDRGREFSPDTTAAFYIGDGALSFDRINPGIVKKGVLVYDVPEGVAFARVRLTNGLFGGESHYVNLVTT